MKPRCTDGSSHHEGHDANSDKANKSKTSTATHTIKAAKGTTNKKTKTTNTKKAKGNGKKGTNTSTATASATLASSSKESTGNDNNDSGNDNNNDDNASGSQDAATTTCLVANALQTGSEQNGQNGTIEAGQEASQTYYSPAISPYLTVVPTTTLSMSALVKLLPMVFKSPPALATVSHWYISPSPPHSAKFPY
jgi:hypothetical protein